MKPLISVIVPTKNEEKNIKNCLESILKQTHPHDKIEIIVVDNNSKLYSVIPIRIIKNFIYE